MAPIGQWLRNVFAPGARTPPDSELTHPRPHSPGPAPLAAGNNVFALEVYRHLLEQNRNLFFSPFSVRTALGMAYAGARGVTATEMAAVLRVPPGGDELHAEFETLIGRLNAGGGGGYELAVANSLWAQDGSPMLPAYADLCARHYGGALYGADFKHAAEEVRGRINRWVEERTGRRIPELIPPGGLDPLTRLVLTNAVYFKGRWSLPFGPKDTRDGPFYLESGKQARVPLMQQMDRVLYVQERGFQAVDLAYEGGDLSMLVILPDRRDGLERVEQGLGSQLLYGALAGMESCMVKLSLPRFKVAWGTIDIGALLKAHGMPTAFSKERADFSGINGYAAPAEHSLSIGKVFHKAFVETNEEGTEAAAATAVVTVTGSSMALPRSIPVFRADHPFLFAIRERRTNTILFLGRIADPTQEH